MHGLMQNRPLLISTLIDYAASWHGNREIVSRDAAGAIHRTTYAALQPRAKRLANALHVLGVNFGQPIATLAWNSFRHLELYYGVTGGGRILHTVNPRLFPEQIQYIINHAEDRFVFFDPVLAPLAEQLAPDLPLVRGWIALCQPDEMPAVKLKNLLCYETIMAAAKQDQPWPSFDENTAATLCYTSGTTGNPKGCCTVIVQPYCTHSAPVWQIHLRSRRGIPFLSLYRYFMPMLGLCRSVPLFAAPSSSYLDRSSTPKAFSHYWQRKVAQPPGVFPQSG
jgi:acyl-CoA synthetase (AMP-forming)/AMP-acid ligase II